MGFNSQGEFQNCHLLTLVYFQWRMLASQKRRRGGKNHLICFIPVFDGSGQSYLGAILLHSLSDTHSSSAEQEILLLSLGAVKNNKLYLRIGDIFYVSCKICPQRSPLPVQMHQQSC